LRLCVVCARRGSGPVGDCPYLGAFLGQRLGEFDGVPCDDRQHRPEWGYVLELGDASVQILEGLLGQAVAAQLGLLVLAWLCRRSPALTYPNRAAAVGGRVGSRHRRGPAISPPPQGSTNRRSEFNQHSTQGPCRAPVSVTGHIAAVFHGTILHPGRSTSQNLYITIHVSKPRPIGGRFALPAKQHRARSVIGRRQTSF
jgi:hypothetical protein